MVKHKEPATEDLRFGDLIAFEWGLAEVRGTITEIYGQEPHQHVVIALTPEVSGHFADEPTTVSVPIDEVRRVTAA